MVARPRQSDPRTDERHLEPGTGTQRVGAAAVLGISGVLVRSITNVRVFVLVYVKA
ncbi:hypothetical protein GCM10009679_79220 [Saccharothrix algeriensis]